MNNFSPAQQKFWLIARLPDATLTYEHLLECALAIAWGEYPRIDLGMYRARLDQFALELRSRLNGVTYPMKQIQIINQFLFIEQQFRGNQANYYDPRNSLITDLLDRKLGIPISLSVLYLILSDRLDIPCVGVNFPGHFLIRPRSPELEILIDPFYGGEIMFMEDCAQRLSQIYEQEVILQPEYLEPIGIRKILERMLMNLKVIYLQQRDPNRALRIVQWLLILYPDSLPQIKDRGLICYQLGNYAEARSDLEDYVRRSPGANDLDAIYQLLQTILNLS